MKLYSYQEKVLESVLSDPSHAQLISMPTGTGKTITFLNIAKHLDKRCLILVHREELLNQTYE
jgi:superfamily II DNA or RNA helicase